MTDRAKVGTHEVISPLTPAGPLIEYGIVFQLRPYQRNLLCRVQYALAANPKSRLMLQLPTGGGKTVIAGALLADWLQNGRRAVWLTHRKELAEQTRGMLTNAGVSAIANVNWTSGDDAPTMARGVVILMAQTVGRRAARHLHRHSGLDPESRGGVWNRYHANDLLVIDEAHHAAADGWTRAMRQWPGPIVGMTATPWRLSEKEGFDHLFDDLLCGPQTADLQALDEPALCQAQVVIPPPEQRIAGGAVDRTGDYTEAGIAQANRDRPDIMTAGALAFWQKHAAYPLNNHRQTIAYAVSVDHARNLAAVFNDDGIPAAVILGDTNREERDKAIAGFRDGDIKILVNVIVATEGFDLPDASCVIIARPTMSLALYLQMVGRGLRPKPDGGDCLILDLAANSERHGLPEDNREWSLKPRGASGTGVAPIVWCPTEWCDVASRASSHHCRGCGYSFGKDCDRCGRWRSYRSRWQYETHCGDAHQHVCDLCHIDAHIQAHLPVAPPLNELVGLYSPEDEMTFPSDVEIDDDLANRLSALLGELLESERQSIVGAGNGRREELRQLIDWRELVLADDEELDAVFEEYIATLPETERPENRVQKRRMFNDWETNLKSELAGWQNEMTELENRAVDKQAVFNSARSKAAYLLRREAQAASLLPANVDNYDLSNSDGVAFAQPPTTSNRPHQNFVNQQNDAFRTASNDAWYSLDTLGAILPITGRPSAVRFPDSRVVNVKNGQDMYREVVEWFIDAGHFDDGVVDYQLSRLMKLPPRPSRPTAKQLSNGMWLEANRKVDQMLEYCRRFAQVCGIDPSQFYVQIVGGATPSVVASGHNASPATPPSRPEPKRFYIDPNHGGIFAQCDVYSAKKIVVLEDSTASKHPISAKGFPNWRKMKDRLVANGVLVDDGQLYKFAIDHELTSPAAVAAMVLSHPQDGRRKLRDARGIPFDHYYPRD